MKRWLWLLLIPSLAGAAARDDYARQWPLVLTKADAGAYRVTLTPEIYENVQSPSLRDLDVVNAEGMTVPAAVLDAEPSVEPASHEVELPWFPLQTDAVDTIASDDLSVIAERNPDGSIRSIRARTSAGEAGTSNPVWLLDASRLRDPIRSLQLEWERSDAPVNLSYRLEASSDLRGWQTLDDRVPLIDLSNAGHRLRQDSIEVNGAFRYLRLVPLQTTAAPRLVSVRARLASVVEQAWQWRELDGTRARTTDGKDVFEFELRGRFPIERADLILPENDSNEWTLESRDHAEAAWLPVAASWVGYRVDAGGVSSRSLPQPLQGITRDGYWRLRSANPLPAETSPRLRLGYRPERLVFLARGAAPYALVAGSARAQRDDAPLPQLLDALRSQRGKDWEPATATTGPASTLAGAQALQPAPAKRDWKAWLLWGVLIAAAATVIAFALSLLRNPKP